MNCDLTAVVAMSDDGGSSGRLRDELGQLPPGDVRQCLVALADDDCASESLRRLFNYRFTAGEGLNGHSFGNLLLSALTDITGSADAAIREASRMLRIRGVVLPVTLTDSALRASWRTAASSRVNPASTGGAEILICQFRVFIWSPRPAHSRLCWMPSLRRMPL